MVRKPLLTATTALFCYFALQGISHAQTRVTEYLYLSTAHTGTLTLKETPIANNALKIEITVHTVSYNARNPAASHPCGYSVSGTINNRNWSHLTVQEENDAGAKLPISFLRRAYGIEIDTEWRDGCGANGDWVGVYVPKDGMTKISEVRGLSGVYRSLSGHIPQNGVCGGSSDDFVFNPNGTYSGPCEQGNWSLRNGVFSWNFTSVKNPMCEDTTPDRRTSVTGEALIQRSGDNEFLIIKIDREVFRGFGPLFKCRDLKR